MHVQGVSILIVDFEHPLNFVIRFELSWQLFPHASLNDKSIWDQHIHNTQTHKDNMNDDNSLIHILNFKILFHSMDYETTQTQP